MIICSPAALAKAMNENQIQSMKFEKPKTGISNHDP